MPKTTEGDYEIMRIFRLTLIGISTILIIVGNGIQSMDLIFAGSIIAIAGVVLAMKELYNEE